MRIDAGVEIPGLVHWFADGAVRDALAGDLT